MLKEEREILEQAIYLNGKLEQSTVAMEECAELVQAISKILRYGSGRHEIDHLSEEIADVSIMLDQLKIMYGIGEKVAEWKSRKLLRLAARIQEKNDD